MPSTIVAPPGFTSWRRFCPLSLTTRRRSAAGLKSTPNVEPDSGTVSWLTLVAVAFEDSV